ncbi:MAG: carboxylesterase family protein, partial [Sphingomonadales bacterium]
MPFGGATAQTRETAPVRTNAGLVAGVEIASGMAFKGVPYAAPPTGERRWRSPEPAIRWSGVKLA